MAHMSQAPPSDTERSMERIITVFQRYSGKQGSRASMNFEEFKEFMNTELGSFTKNQKDPQILQKIMKCVDGGGGKADGELDFQEFLNMIGGMMVAGHAALSKCPPAKQNPVFATKPTEIEVAMESLIRVFMRYAGKKGDSCQMDCAEFEEFMKTELKSFTDNQKDPNAWREVMKSADGSVDCKKDNQLNFQEFMNLIGGIMVACNAAMLKHMARV